MTKKEFYSKHSGFYARYWRDGRAAFLHDIGGGFWELWTVNRYGYESACLSVMYLDGFCYAWRRFQALIKDNK